MLSIVFDGLTAGSVTIEASDGQIEGSADLEGADDTSLSGAFDAGVCP